MVTVYLAGPVEKSDDPETWREEAKQYSNMVDFIDPVEMYSDADDDSFGGENVWHLLKTCVKSDAVMVYANDNIPTWGTPIEQFYASWHGVPVIVVRGNDNKDDDPPSFMDEFTDVYSPDVETAVRDSVRILA